MTFYPGPEDKPAIERGCGAGIAVSNKTEASASARAARALKPNELAAYRAGALTINEVRESTISGTDSVRWCQCRQIYSLFVSASRPYDKCGCGGAVLIGRTHDQYGRKYRNDHRPKPPDYSDPKLIVALQQ